MDAHVETFMCRGSHTMDRQLRPRRHAVKHDMPIVALGCAPYHYLMCNQEYNLDQMMESTCICHPLYAVENKNYTDNANDTSKPKELQCLPMAGVPCKFNVDTTTSFGRLLFAEVQCAPNMMCKNLTAINRENMENKSNWELFEKTFAGFGMSPIARDYMVSRAMGMCVCNKEKDVHGNMIEKFIQTPFNECLEPLKGGSVMQRGWMNGKKLVILMLLMTVINLQDFFLRFDCLNLHFN